MNDGMIFVRSAHLYQKKHSKVFSSQSDDLTSNTALTLIDTSIVQGKLQRFLLNVEVGLEFLDKQRFTYFSLEVAAVSTSNDFEVIHPDSPMFGFVCVDQ